MQDKTTKSEMWTEQGQSIRVQDHRLLCLAADWAEYSHQLAIAFVIHTWGVIAASDWVCDDHQARYGNCWISIRRLY